MEVLRDFIPSTTTTEDPDSASARRIRMFFNLDETALANRHDLEKAQQGLGSLVAALDLVDLIDAEKEKLSGSLPHIAEWLRGTPTRQVIYDLEINQYQFDPLVTYAMDVMGVPVVYETITAQHIEL